MREQLFVLLVALAGEAIDVALDVAHETLAAGEPLAVLTCCNQTLVTGKRHLRIDDHRPPFGQHDDDVRPLRPAGFASQTSPRPCETYSRPAVRPAASRMRSSASSPQRPRSCESPRSACARPSALTPTAWLVSVTSFICSLSERTSRVSAS